MGVRLDRHKISGSMPKFWSAVHFRHHLLGEPTEAKAGTMPTIQTSPEL
jgi:hypothetical protein